MFGREWSFSAPCLALALLITAYLSPVPPDREIQAMMGASIVLVGASRFMVRLEARYAYNVLSRFLLMVGIVGLPMILFGISMARMLGAGMADYWPQAVGLMVLAGTAATATLKGRAPSTLTGMMGMWAGFSAASGYNSVVVTACLGLAAGYLLTSAHLRRQQLEAERVAVRQREQQRARELLAEFEQTGQGWFWETDTNGLITYLSPKVAEQLGSDNDSIIGRPFHSLFILDSLDSERERTLVFQLSAHTAFRDVAVQAATSEAEERWWSITGRPVTDESGNFSGFRGSGSDFTERRKAERHVTQLARFDPLTKLANRLQMSELLSNILNAQRAERRACAIFILDLDRFKQVNDTLGHPAGDTLLRQVADRLRSTVGKSGSVGRLGGDEFQILLPGNHEREPLAQLAERIIENLTQPYSIEGHRITIGASIGIAVCPQHGTCAEELIRNADLALYAAKDGGRGRHHFYARDLHSDAEERRRLEQDLRDAITQGELELHYQPVVGTTTERITGFEALLRWNHPKHGYLSPAKFIPIAEDTGLVAQIGEWALRTACMDLARWPESVRVAVNVSPLQFANPSLPGIVASAIAAAGIDPTRVELEITESVFLNDDSGTDAMFKALKALGIRLALDDFGTGYSSLGYLKKAPFDKIKIDQSFVRGATVDGSRNGAIMASIVSLAESLGMETTAEGIETFDELDLMRSLGCSHIQGFIYSRPLTLEGAMALLESGLTLVPDGPRAARESRKRMLRKVILYHGGHRYGATIRNISSSGALVEGLWNVPPATEFDLHFSPGHVVKVIARWSRQDHMGVAFAQPLAVDENGGVIVGQHIEKEQAGEDRQSLLKAG